MAPSTHSLDSIVNVQVLVSPLAAVRATFNQLLIVGSATVISTADRLKKYESLADMIDDGFVITDPEYIAAALYFGQTPQPLSVFIGRADVGGDDASFLAAVQDCRAKNFEWYTCMVCDAAKADHEAIAAYIESATPSSVYAFTTKDADVPAGTAGNVFADLKASGYKRTIGQYSTDNDYAIAAIMGYAMGQNSGLANSAFTLKFKPEVGVTAELLTTTEIATIKGNNGNVYLSYGNTYNWFVEGVMADGTFFDQIINRDMLANNIQLNVADLLNGSQKIPQTEAGVSQIINACNSACSQSASIGYIGPGTWTGPAVLNLKNGDALPSGYLTQAAALADQSQADRDARKSPSIYVAVKEAGAVHSVLIGVYIDQ